MGMGTLGAVAIQILVAADAVPVEVDLRAQVTHTAEALAPGVLLRYDPSRLSSSEAALEAARASKALRAVEEALEERLDAPALLFVYRDAKDLVARTGAPPEWGGFATATGSVHAPLGAPLRHELAHVVARRIPGAAKDPGGLLREGLAAAMEESDRGISVGDWAAVERRLGLLAPLADLRSHWPEGPPAGAHPYHAAGAFVRWLLETRGLSALKALYAGPDRASESLGEEWGDLEAAWHESLDARPVEEHDEAAVRRWFGLPVERLPPRLSGARSADLLDGDGLEGFSLRRPGSWAADGGRLRGNGPSDAFASLETWRDFPADAAVRASFATAGDAALFLRVNRAEEGSDEALLRPDGVFFTMAVGVDSLSRAPRVRIVPGRRTEVVLETRGRAARLYLDGWLVHEVKDAFRGGGGAVGLGVRDGSVEVHALEVLLPGR